MLFEDETDLLLFPPLRAAWSLRGEPAAVPISGVNAKRVAYGVINARTGTRLFLVQKNHRQESFHAFLDLVHRHYRGWQVAMVLDEERGHTANASQALAQRLDIELLWLPKRSPHLNPMDHLWRMARRTFVPTGSMPISTTKSKVSLFIFTALRPQKPCAKQAFFRETFGWIDSVKRLLRTHLDNRSKRLQYRWPRSPGWSHP